MKLRSQLVFLALVALLPVAALAAILGAFLIQQQRDTFRQGTEARVLALVTAVDAELSGSIGVLRALANVRSLDQRDLKLFRASAGQILREQDNWATINLALPDGQQVMNLRIAEGARLPRIPPEDESLARLARTVRPAIGDMVFGPSTGRWDFAVRVPVVRKGKLAYILSAVVKPESIARLVESQGLPRDWEGMVVDRNGRIVARTVEPASLGQYASEGLRKALGESSGGWYRGSNLEGVPKYRAYRRSDDTGWTFAMAIPTQVVDATAMRAIWIFGLALAAALIGALALARLVGARIAEPITQLAAATDRLAQGENVEIKQSARSGELRALQTALRNAAGAQVALQRAEEEVRLSETRLRMALTAGRMGVYEYKPLERVSWWSPECYAIHGVSPESFDPMDGGKLVHPEDFEKVLDITRSIEERRPWAQEYRIVRPDGEVRWVAGRAQTEFDKDGKPCFHGVIIDVTEHKRAEEAIKESARALREADRHKDEFLAMLSHELRNPLAALTTAAHVLRAAAPNDPTTAGAQGVIDRQTQHMVRLVEDLLDITRVRLGKLSLKREPLDFSRLVSEVTQGKRDAGAFKARAAVVLEASPVWVNGDRARLEQVYSNLLDNALKFTPASGTVRVSVRREGSKAVLSVADDGPGIAADVLLSVFELFVQGEQNLARAQGGLGLGLALVRRLAELHDGDVTAASEGIGRGAAFTVSLPAIDEPSALRLEGAPRRVAQHTPLRIVIVEDNQDARQMLCAALRMQGHDVVEAANGAAGLEAVLECNPDVVLLDIGLPDMDGYEVARGVRALPHGPSTVLIAVSGYGRDDDQGRASAAGFDAHVVKPAGAEEIADVIAALVARKRVAAI